MKGNKENERNHSHNWNSWYLFGLKREGKTKQCGEGAEFMQSFKD